MLCASVGGNTGSCRNIQHLCEADMLILISESWSDSGSCRMSPNSNNEKKTIKQRRRKQAVTVQTRDFLHDRQKIRWSGMRHGLTSDWFLDCCTSWIRYRLQMPSHAGRRWQHFLFIATGSGHVLPAVLLPAADPQMRQQTAFHSLALSLIQRRQLVTCPQPFEADLRLPTVLLLITHSHTSTELRSKNNQNPK